MNDRTQPHNYAWARGCLEGRVNNLRADFRRHIWDTFNQFEGPNGETLLNRNAEAKLREHVKDVEALLANHTTRTAAASSDLEAVAAE